MSSPSDDAGQLPTVPAPPGTTPTLQRTPPKDASSPTVIKSEPSPRLRIPARLGPYELGDEIGHGGMGVVFRARHTKLGTPCAVKVLIAGEHASPESLARFHREAAAVARMGKHPNIVAVHDLGQEEGITYYAMELVEGTALDARTAIGPIDPREAAAIVEPIARALHFAHGHGIVHRDLKPANVLLRGDGTPLVMDFGLARDVAAAGRLSLTGEVFGSPNYMAPEQVRGQHEACDARTDVYGLGGVLYEALMAQPPHPGTDIATIFEEILAGELLRPRRLRPGIPRDLETVCLKCLETDPARRYPTAEALADDLARFLRGEPVEARPVGVVERLWRGAVRRRSVVVPVSLALLVAAGVSIWALMGSLQRAAAARTAVELGRGYRAQGQAREARDAFQKALGLDDSIEEARDGFKWADDLIRQAEEQAERQRLLAEKQELVGRVYARWSEIRRVVRELEKLTYDMRIGDEEKRSRREACWRQVQEVVDETPTDPTSRAATLALLGWAHIAAGEHGKGLELLRDSAACDPDVPLGMQIEVLACFRAYVEAFPVPTYVIGAKGWAFSPTEAEAKALAPLRERLRASIERVGETKFWGAEADPYRRTLDAVLALDRGDFESTEKSLTEALAIPGSESFEPHLLLARAKVRYRLLRYDGALEDLEEAGGHLPGYPLLPCIEGSVRMSRAVADQGVGRDPRPELDGAIAACRRALEVDPEFAAVRNLAGLAWDARAAAERAYGEDPKASLEHAVEELEAAVRSDPDRAAAAGNLANAQRHLAEDEARRGIDPRHRIEGALRAISGAIDGGADDVGTRISRALVHRALADLDQARGADPRAHVEAAIADLSRAIELDPEACEAWNNRASQRLGLARIEATGGEDPTGTIEEALADCDEAIARNAGFAQSFAIRGQVKQTMAAVVQAKGGDPLARLEEAIEDFRKALGIDPALEEIHGMIASTLLTAAGADEALGRDPEPRYRQAVQELDDGYPGARRGSRFYVTRGDAHERLAGARSRRGLDPRAAFRKAAADFDEALKLAPGTIEVLVHRGDCMLGIGLADRDRGDDPKEAFRKAREDYEAAVAKEPRLWQAYGNLGQLLLEMNEPARAAEAYEAALKACPGEPRLAAGLERARKAAGQ